MKELIGILDQVEGETALIEIDGQLKEYPIRLLPKGIKEGDVVSIIGNSITIDKQQTNTRRQRIAKLMDDAWE